MTPIEAKTLLAFALAPNYVRSSAFNKEIFDTQAEGLILGTKTLSVSYPIIPERFIKKILEKYPVMTIIEGRKELNKMLKEEQRNEI